MSEEIETGVSHIAYFRTDGGSSKLYTQEYVDELQDQLQQKENIIKEAINYIKEESWFCYKDNEEIIDRTLVNKLLEILGDNDENI